MKKPNLVVVLGSTASGKTSLSIELAKKINGEIVSSDSMQIYKGLPISTAQPTKNEMQDIPHHLIGYIDPMFNYSVGEYQKKAIDTINNIIDRGKTPILCGGSGLYIDSVMYNMDFANTTNDLKIRKKYTDYYNKFGANALYEILTKMSPLAAKRIHPNNINRVIRALEIKEISGKEIDEYNNENMKNYRYNTCIFGLSWEREVLYDRINSRVDIMLANGMLEEIIRMKEYGVKRGHTAYKAIGFKEFTPYLNSEILFEEAIEKVKQHSRNYAKRQATWFKRLEGVNWIKFNQNTSICHETTKLLQIIENNNF